MRQAGIQAVEIAVLLALPVVMGFGAALGVHQAAALDMVVVVGSLLLFFGAYEWRRPTLRETMPVVVLAALAAAGRILFAPLPDVKPVSAICILAGAVFGRQNGFMVGALAALVSNFFFGQGAWTPWQMYGWGLVGYLAGVLFYAKPGGEGQAVAERGAAGQGVAGQGLAQRGPAWGVYAYGFASGILFGLVMNLWSILGFFQPQTLAEGLALWALALPLDVVHGIATVGFLVVLWAPWRRKLLRLRAVYGLA